MIQSISRGCKGTLSDGSVRYVFEFGPNDAADAAKLFGMPGTPSLCSAFTVEAAQKSAQDEIINHIGDVNKMVDKPKGGALAKLAGMWCGDSNFLNFIRPLYDKLLGGNGSGWGDVDWTMANSEFSRHAILVFCDIDSRAELDNNPEAAEKFHRLIREPYKKYLETL